jgi:hypothetical protein
MLARPTSIDVDEVFPEDDDVGGRCCSFSSLSKALDNSSLMAVLLPLGFETEDVSSSSDPDVWGPAVGRAFDEEDDRIIPRHTHGKS